MTNFGGITHVIDNRNGSYSLVGDVPVAMMAKQKPTASDIMSGRVQRDGHVYVCVPYSSVDEIKRSVQACGGHLCDIPTCACRKLF